jgi:hypothetical protein
MLKIEYCEVVGMSQTYKIFDIEDHSCCSDTTHQNDKHMVTLQSFADAAKWIVQNYFNAHMGEFDNIVVREGIHSWTASEAIKIAKIPRDECLELS